MKITIEANPKEIADFVSQLQNQPHVLQIDIKAFEAALCKKFKSSASIPI